MIFNAKHLERQRHYITQGLQPPVQGSDVHKGYLLFGGINAENVDFYVHAYHKYMEEHFPDGSDLASQTLALKLAVYFRKTCDLTRMSQFLAEASQHCLERKRYHADDQETSLATVLRDENFQWFFSKFGNMMFLGRLIADAHITRLYVAPHSMLSNGVEALAHVLKTKPKLKMLDVAYQDIDNHGAIALAEALRNHSAINKVYLGGNKIGQEGIEALRHLPAHMEIILGEQKRFIPRQT